MCPSHTIASAHWEGLVDPSSCYGQLQGTSLLPPVYYISHHVAMFFFMYDISIVKFVQQTQIAVKHLHFCEFKFFLKHISLHNKNINVPSRDEISALCER